MKKQTDWVIKYSIAMSFELGGLVLIYLLLYAGVIQISYLRWAMLTTFLAFPNLFGATVYVLTKEYPLKLGNKGEGALSWVYALSASCVIGIVFGNILRDSSIPVFGAIFRFWPILWILYYFINALIVVLALRRHFVRHNINSKL